MSGPKNMASLLTARFTVPELQFAIFGFRYWITVVSMVAERRVPRVFWRIASTSARRWFGPT